MGICALPQERLDNPVIALFECFHQSSGAIASAHIYVHTMLQKQLNRCWPTGGGGHMQYGVPMVVQR